MSGGADPHRLEDHMHHFSLKALKGSQSSWQVREKRPHSGGSGASPEGRV